MNQAQDEKNSQHFRQLFKIGGVSAFIAVFFGIIQIIINGLGASASIIVPSNVVEWFALLQSNRLFGLAALTFFEVPSFAFIFPVFLALYIRLRQINWSLMSIGTLLGVVGTTIFLATNSALSLSVLSDQYTVATTETQRIMLIGAGHAVLTTYQVIGINIGVLLSAVSILIISVVMYQSKDFSRVTSYLGILDGIVTLAYYPLSIFTTGSVFVLISSGPLLLLWLILVGHQLIRLGDFRK